MGDYQDYFKAQRRKQKLTKGMKTSGARKGLPVPWLLVVTLIVAIGVLWSVWGPGLLDVSVFTGAQAQEKAGKTDKSADKAASGAEKSAASDKSTPEKSASGTASNTASTSGQQHAYSAEELTLFTKLEARKKQLDAHEEEIKKLEADLQRQRDEIEARLKALDEVRAKIADRLDGNVKSDQEKVDTLVSMYSSMNPASAAKILEDMNEDLAVAVLSKMKNKTAAEILNVMDAEKAKKLTEKFAGYKDPDADNANRSPANAQQGSGGNGGSSNSSSSN